MNGKDVLPPELLAEVQRYLCGELLYIPKNEGKAEWGSVSGCRASLDDRNSRIREGFRHGKAIADLTVEFCLSEASIRKIVYSPRLTREA